MAVKRCLILISPEMRNQAKIQAAKLGISIKQYIETLIKVDIEGGEKNEKD